MSDRLDSLLLAWQEQHARGCEVTAADVCRDCPELAAELGTRIAALQQMNALLQGTAAPCTRDSREGTLPSGQGSWQTGCTNDASGTLRSLGENRSGVRLEVAAVPGYDILGELGRGGMGVVYKARQQTLNRIVALKMILSGSHAGPAALARFLKEGELLARLKHPNVVQVYEYGSHGGTPYFSLEYLEGGSLAAKINGEPQAPVEAARTVQTLARAVHAAHQQGIVHRDLKPANVLLADDGTPKVTDFGLAKQGDSAMTATGEVMGTPSYMAPEQASGKIKEVGAAADVYALGAILYDLLTGRPPFKGASVWDTIQMVTDAEPVPPSQLQLKVPRDLEVVCLKCLQKEPAKRYASALALADDLGRFLEGAPILALPVSRPERLWRWCKRKPLVATLVASLALVLAGSFIGVTLLWLHAEDRRLAAVQAQKLAQELAAEATRQQTIANEQSRRARAEADNAKREANKAQRTAQVLMGMFQAADPLGLSGIPALKARGGEKLTALEILRGGARTVLRDLGGEPDAQAKLLDSLGHVFCTLGLPGDARPLLEKALTIQRTLPHDHPDLAATLHNLGWLHHQTGDYPAARRYYGDALAVRRQHAATDPASLSATLLNLGWLLADMREYAAAEKMFQEAVAVRLASLGPDHRDTAVARGGLAALHIDQGKFLEAIPPYQQAMATLRKVEGGKGLAQSIDLFQKGILGRELPVLVRRTLLGLSDDEAVRHCFEQSLELARQTLGDNHVYTGLVHHELAATLVKHGNDSAAELHFRECLRIARLYGLDHPKVTIVLANFTSLLKRRSKQDEAHELLAEAIAVRQKRYPEGHAGIADVKFLQAHLLPAQEPSGRRALLLREAFTMYCRSPGVSQFAVPCLEVLAESLPAPKIIDLARELARAAAARKDSERDRLLDLAMNALRRARQKGFRGWEGLRDDRNLDGLRERSDFRKFIAETT